MTNIEKFKEVFGFTPTDQICVMTKDVECPEDCGQCEYGSFWYDEYKDNTPPKTGHWIMTGDYLITACGNVDYVKCSCCREYSLEEGDYCPNCGARMIDPQESEG